MLTCRAHASPLQNVEKPADMRDQADLFGSDAGGNTSLGQHFGLQVTMPRCMTYFNS